MNEYVQLVIDGIINSKNIIIINIRNIDIKSGIVVMYQRQLQYQAQNRLYDEQDQHIEQITQIARQMKQQGKQMNRQLQQQRQYAEQLDYEMDMTSNKLNNVQKKLGKLLHTNDAGQICTCLMMVGLTLIFTLCIIII